MTKTMNKRLLSTILVMIFVFTTFCFADLGLTASAWETVTQTETAGRPSVVFYVPETIYLSPGGTSFQYFVDCGTDGALDNSRNKTTGRITFKSDAALDSLTINCVNISASNASVYSKNAGKTNSVIDTLSSGTASGGNILKWTAEYTANDKTFHSYAYTYVYAPEFKQSGHLLRHEYDGDYGEPANHAFLFITGIHAVSGGTKESKFVNTNAKPYSPLVYYDRAHTDGGSGIIGSTTYFADTNGGGVSYIASTSRGVIDPADGDNSTERGVITIDKSRYSNYNQIPNLYVGYTQYYHHWDGAGNYLYWIMSATGFTDTDVEDADPSGAVNIRVLDSETPDVTDGDDNANCYGLYPLRGALPTSDRSDTIYAKHKNGWKGWPVTESAYSIIGTTLETRIVNKASLRAKYREACNVAIEDDYNYGATLTNFATSLQTAGAVLGNPTATSAQITSAYSDLNTKCAALKNAQPTLDQSFISPSVKFYVPETIYLDPTDGYTFQYFYGVDETGAVTQNITPETAAQGALIYFDGNGFHPDSVNISCQPMAYVNDATDYTNVSTTYAGPMTIDETNYTWDQIYTSGLQFNSSQMPVNRMLTAGSLDSASERKIGAGNTLVLRWKAVYAVDGAEHTTYAYTVVYSPYTNVAGAYGQAGYDSTWHTDFNVGGTSWITGIHSVSTGITGREFSSDNGGEKGAYCGQPLVNNIVPRAGNDNHSDIRDPSGIGIFADYCKDGDITIQGGTGNLTVDRSRFTNYQYIPNLKAGLDINNYEVDAERSYAGQGVYKSGGTDNSTNVGTIGSKSINGDNYFAGQRLWQKSFNLAVGTGTSETVISHGQIYGENVGNASRTVDGYTYMDVTICNKAALRSAVQDAVNAARQEDWYSSGYAAYQNSILLQSVNVGHPAISDVSGSIDTGSLNYKIGAVSARHINAVINSRELNNECMRYRYGSDIAAGFNQYVGYTPLRYTELEYDGDGTNLFSFSDWAGNSNSGASNSANMTVVSKDTTNGIVKFNTTTAGDNFTRWSSGGVNSAYYQTPVSANTQYTFSFQYSGTATGQFFVFNAKSGSWSVAASSKSLEATDDDSTYKQYVYTFTTDPGTIMLDYRFGSYGSTGTSCFKNIKLVESGSGTTINGNYPGTPSEKKNVTKSYSYVFYYQPNTYHAIFDPAMGVFNGKTMTSVYDIYYDDGMYVGRYVNGEDQAAVDPPTKVGYDFVGWLCSADGQVYAQGTTDEATDTIWPWKWDHDVTFTAQWTANTYSIAYELNGGTAGTSQPTVGTYDTLVTISNPVRTGYTFAGWSSSTSAGLGAAALTGSSPTGAFSAWMGAKTTNQYFRNLRNTSGTVTLTANWIEQVHEHSYTPAVTTEPTCTTDGVMTYTCSCGDSYTEVIPALGHDYDAVVTEPTCTADGFTTYTCSRCGDSYVSGYTNALGHDFGEWFVTVQTTTETPGEERRECSRCDAFETRVIPKLPDGDSPTFALTGGTVRAGETIEVSVLVQNNPGLVSAVLRLSYDPQILTLTDVSNGDVFPDTAFSPASDRTAIPYGMGWLDALAEDYTQNGTLVTFTFTVAADAPSGATAVTLTYDTASTFNAQLAPVDFAVQNAEWQIAAHFAGDVTGDGSLNLKDAVTLIRSIVGGWGVSIVDVNADVNRDGSIDMKDAALIIRYLADWDVVLQ